MTKKMSHEEYIKLKKKEIKEAANGLLKGTVDPVAASRSIFLYWSEVGFPEEDKSYLFFNHLDDEFEQFSPDSRELHKPLPLSQISQEEKEILEYYKDHIINACKTILEKYFP